MILLAQLGGVDYPGRGQISGWVILQLTSTQKELRAGACLMMACLTLASKSLQEVGSRHGPSVSIKECWLTAAVTTVADYGIQGQ